MRQKPNRQRNLLHDHPLLKKGGVHGKSRKAERQQAKRALRKARIFPGTPVGDVRGKIRAAAVACMTGNGTKPSFESRLFAWHAVTSLHRRRQASTLSPAARTPLNPLLTGGHRASTAH
ncbi:MAG: hypothetical protein KDJ27_13095 [Gammaproteobacteria bacterium]|nr:hypothetical protein [Gammaproteobacteria bacterium]